MTNKEVASCGEEEQATMPLDSPTKANHFLPRFTNFELETWMVGGMDEQMKNGRTRTPRAPFVALFVGFSAGAVCVDEHGKRKNEVESGHEVHVMAPKLGSHITRK